MPLFFLFFLLIPLSGQVYVSVRVWQMLSLPVWGKTLIVCLMALCFITFFVSLSGILSKLPLNMGTLLYEVGTSWVIILLYLFMAFVLVDIGRLWLGSDWYKGNIILSICMTVAMTALFIYGNLHYRNKHVEHFALTTHKAIDRPQKLIFVSDLHMGYHNRRAEIARWVDMLNAEHADMILIAGDLIDGFMHPVETEDMAAELRRLNAPVYACPGNHDHMTGIDNVTRFCQQASISLLRDSAVQCGRLTIIGRDDRSNRHRQTVKELMSRVDTFTYTILLDHQPYHLEEAEHADIDLQLSGHTHEGQVWPANLITNAIYEQDYGRWQRGHTQYYISSGLGIWGGKFRIGTRSEYVVIDLAADDAKAS
ncbi:MAG: metallophosphoesterase [Paludibacteraceae bacterium]|nr:metallophosphoesterase [Paludibacteraceae bacterium]